VEIQRKHPEDQLDGLARVRPKQKSRGFGIQRAREFQFYPIGQTVVEADSIPQFLSGFSDQGKVLFRRELHGLKSRKEALIRVEKYLGSQGPHPRGGHVEGRRWLTNKDLG
jgi:hypothetical protein